MFVTKTSHFLLITVISLFMVSCTAGKSIVQNQEQDKVEVAIEIKDNSSHISVSTSDPIMLRTFLMQGFSLDMKFNNSGFRLQIPSAKDVENKIQRHPGEVKATIEGDKEKRPDIRPIINALNESEIKVTENGRQIGVVNTFNVSVQPESGLLTYKIDLHKENELQLPLHLILKSSPFIAPEPEFQKESSDNEETGRPQPFGAGQPFPSNDPRKEISIIYNFP